MKTKRTLEQNAIVREEWRRRHRDKPSKGKEELRREWGYLEEMIDNKITANCSPNF